ncbi:MAG: TetR/AcrR family transcriptional regulator [Actinomycetota bacterium]|nr:TetR/AcrR family transcriptional regulator [Actinomycetota bacterium]
MAVAERRLRRRQETISEIVDAAWTQAADVGVGQISLRRLADDVGMRAPSLYEYFPSKLALYDALFAAAATEYREQTKRVLDASEPTRALYELGELLLRFALEAPAKYQLVFQRPVPDFVPSVESFAISQEIEQDFIAAVRMLVEAGEVDARILEQASLDLMTAIGSGLAAQQIANEPEASFSDGRWTRLLPMVDDMIRTFFAPRSAGSSKRRRP